MTTHQIHVIHRLICPTPEAAVFAFAAAAGAFGADAPKAMAVECARQIAFDRTYSPDLWALSFRANLHVTNLDEQGCRSRVRINYVDEHTVLKDGIPVRWVVDGAPLANGETMGGSVRDVLTFGPRRRSAVRLVGQRAHEREAKAVGGSGFYIEIGYLVRPELDPFSHTPEMPADDPYKCARTRLAAALAVLDDGQAAEPRNPFRVCDETRAIGAEIFAFLDGRRLGDVCLPVDLRGRAESAWIIQEAPHGEWDWCISADSVVLLGAGRPTAVAEAHRIIDETAVAVCEHGHGQGPG